MPLFFLQLRSKQRKSPSLMHLYPHPLPILSTLALALGDSSFPLPLCASLVPQLPSQMPTSHRLSQSCRLGKARRRKLRLKKDRTPCPRHRDWDSSLCPSAPQG